jgi:hypothetical protein
LQPIWGEKGVGVIERGTNDRVLHSTQIAVRSLHLCFYFSPRRGEVKGEINGRKGQKGRRRGRGKVLKKDNYNPC